jgi:hypothetical protein
MNKDSERRAGGQFAARTREETVQLQRSVSLVLRPTDKERLEWLVKSEAFVTRQKRQKTRRGGLVEENMEDYYCVDWVSEDGALCWQGADGGRLDWRDAIDAAMQAQNEANDQTEAPRS